jgi:hypothetical protein
MRRRLLTAWAGVFGLWAGGCVSSRPLLENPVLLHQAPPSCADNPVYVELPRDKCGYAKVFEKTLDVLGEYFVVATANRYEGRIVTHPRIAPGFEQFFKAGSPSCDERLLATLQTIRHHAIVKIAAAEDGGFWVDLKVYKELEDLATPIRSTAGAAIFRSEPTIERQYEVVEPVFTAPNWIPLGRDESLEQAILQKLKRCL